MGRLVNFLVLVFRIPKSEDLSIFQSLNDESTNCHFRDFSDIVLKSLIICIVNDIYLKAPSQNNFQLVIISLSFLVFFSTATLCVVLSFSVTCTFHGVS